MRTQPSLFCKIFLCSLFIVNCYAWSEEEVIDRFLARENDDSPPPFSCDSTCAVPMEGLPALGACGLDGNLYFNRFANSTLSSYFQCLIKNIGQPNPNIGINYPGSCGCPNYCGNITNSGSCVNGKCECASGWGGPDCSQGMLERC